MASETAVVGAPLPLALPLLSDFLSRNGFKIEVYSFMESRLMLYQEGGWFSRARHIILEFSPMNEGKTRVEISAFTGKSFLQEDIITEEKLAAAITRKWIKSPNTPS